MNKLRNDNPVLVYGKYELLQPEHPTIYAYTRKMGQDKMLILLNFSKENATIDLPEITPTLPPHINNYDACDIQGHTAHLLPCQGVVFGVE